MAVSVYFHVRSDYLDSLLMDKGNLVPGGKQNLNEASLYRQGPYLKSCWVRVLPCTEGHGSVISIDLRSRNQIPNIFLFCFDFYFRASPEVIRRFGFLLLYSDHGSWVLGIPSENLTSCRL